MYSKQQASQMRHEFWTVFGQYMAPVLSADGEKINWINYKTGEKDIRFRMDVLNNAATIGIEIIHSDPGIQQLYFEQFLQLKNVLHTTIGEQWTWEPHVQTANGKSISRIHKVLEGKSIMNRAHWPDLIAFFKPRLIALEAFWNSARYAFELLR